MLTLTPYKIASLLDMLKFYADDFVKISINLGKLSAVFAAPQFQDMKSLHIDAGVVQMFEDLCVPCRNIGLGYSLKQADRIKSILENPNPQIGELSAALESFCGRITDELESVLVMRIPPERVQYFQQPSLFGDEVFNNFKSARRDIEEAGSCFAAARYTACAMHLMRVCEVGLLSVGAGMQIKSKLLAAQPDWGNVLGELWQEIQRRDASGDPAWTPELRNFFDTARASLQLIKNVWRNPTMHVERFYQDFEVEDVLHSIKGFTRYLAGHLDEQGNFTP